MPFKSQKQAAWMFVNHPDMAKEWASHTTDIHGLPVKVRDQQKPKAKKKAKK